MLIRKSLFAIAAITLTLAGASASAQSFGAVRSSLSANVLAKKVPPAPTPTATKKVLYCVIPARPPASYVQRQCALPGVMGSEGITCYCPGIDKEDGVTRWVNVRDHRR